MLALEIIIPIVGAILNIILSSIVPCLLKNTKKPFLTELKNVFINNRKVIMSSSLIVAVIIYLAIKVTIQLDLVSTNENFENKINNLQFIDSIDTDSIINTKIPEPIILKILKSI